MEFYVWDKESPVMGLSAQVILNSRVDFIHDDVIVIHRKDNKNEVVKMESMSYFRDTYDIDSIDPYTVGFLVSVILAQEEAQSVKEMLEEIDKKNKLQFNEEENAFIEEYAKFLESLIQQEIENQCDNDIPIPLIEEYIDPDCTVIDLSDIENVHEKKLTVVLNHAFISEDDMMSLKCMEEFKRKVQEIEDEREKYVNESNFEAVERTTKQLNAMLHDIEDPCDATIKLDVEKVYQYGDAILIDCVNGQTVMIDNNVISSFKTSAIEYEKSRGNENERYKVHYKTVNIMLSECYNEVIERGNTLFVISV